MGLKAILFLSSTVLVGLIGIKLNTLLQVPSLPTLEDTWWGPGEAKQEETSIKPFKINVKDEVLLDLKNRLKNTRTLTKPLEGIQQQYGFNSDVLKEILDYWLNKYDWRKREKYLNSFPQFTTKIQGLNIHYLHVKPSVPTGTVILPLLLLHGWPGSVTEFYKIIPILSKVHLKYNFAFELIVPSLPGFGFSDGASKPGLGMVEMAVVFKNLMKRIGYDQFYLQGGDLGALIVKHMATLYPENILGLHTNMGASMGKKSMFKVLLGSVYPPFVVSKEFEHHMYPLSSNIQLKLEETGYLHIQATKPDTVGVGLLDSPAALAAYILEKFSTGTNRAYKQRKDAGLLEKFTYDELIDNLMVYWITESIVNACRAYANTFNKKQMGFRLDDIPIDAKVPCAVARFPNEIMYQPDWILKDKFVNLVQATDFKQGGHFAALEEPQLLAEDIFSAVSKMKKLGK